ncbi:sensor histidine kinase [Plantactinospora sp. GCM10030261]|uniref:sensor histidine kinase n=1 Tax=Plantactinospora sp. GCM10030261 TaxID=3273420 RepID=UPI00360F3215
MRATKVDAGIAGRPARAEPGGSYGETMRDPSWRRDRWADVGVVTLAALLGGLFFLDSIQTAANHGAGFPVVDLVVGGLACGALLLRRRWPVALALVLIPSLAASAAALGPTAVAIAAVAVYRPWPVATAVLAAHVATVGTLFRVVAGDTREFWQGLVVVLALDAALAASAMLIRSQRLLVQALRDRAAEAEERQRLRVEEARHAERERIAREMHDVLAHRISLLAMHAGALQVRRSADPDERHAAGVVRQCAYQALEDLREVIGMLRDDGTDGDRPQPTLSGVPALVEQSRAAGMRVSLDGDAADLAAVPDSIGRHLYRVVQEGLTNARKHAPDAPVHVRIGGATHDAVAPHVDGATTDRADETAALDADGGAAVHDDGGAGLVVEVRNGPPAGSGSARLPGSGSGLIGLQERMHLAGGRLRHEATTDGGFRLWAWLPWRP